MSEDNIKTPDTDNETSQQMPSEASGTTKSEPSTPANDSEKESGESGNETKSESPVSDSESKGDSDEDGDDEEYDDDDGDGEEYNESDENAFFENFVPSANNNSEGMDVTNMQLDKYNTEVDAEKVKSIRREWRENKRKKKKLSPLSALLMLGVAGFIPWYLYGIRQDLVYFFSSSDAIELGSAQDYRISEEEEKTKKEDFEDNRFVKIQGIPIRHVGIEIKENPVLPRSKKLVYQLLGSSVYIQEDFENSRFASFMSNTSANMMGNTTVEELEVSGRLRRFDTSDIKKYAPVRDYYSQKYNTVFCESMSDSDLIRKKQMLGRGGVTIQIMPDNSILQAETNTRVTLRDVKGLRGRSAIAIGDNNVVLHSKDAGRSWQKSELPISSQVTSIAFEPNASQIVFGGQNGWVGGESYRPSQNSLSISQDVLDVAFTEPEPGDTTAPRMIAVGREGLIQVAYMQREGWTPSRIDDNIRFNDILRTDDKWFAAGDLLLTRADDAQTWTREATPKRVPWFSLTQIPDAVVATGAKGAVARYDLKSKYPTWKDWPVDDVPGIDFDADIRASAVSDDGKTWVGVGNKGSILVAKADDSGQFGPIQRISGSYASYGVVRDILAGNSVEAALYEALQRYTEEDFHDITYHDGTFYAVGSESLLMTSKDGLSWTMQHLQVKHKLLHTIAFTGPKTGVIGGEKGTLLITDDNGATWRQKKAPSERSIYDITTSPIFPNAFTFVGSYGLWGYCSSISDNCNRSRNESYRYRAAALDKDQSQKRGINIIAVGDDSHIDRITGVPGEALVTPLWERGRSNVTAMAFADRELPLLPNSSRGTLGLIAAGNGSVFRSLDAGYSFQREETGLSSPITHLAISRNGDTVLAFDGKGNTVESVHGLSQWKPLPGGFRDGAVIGTTSYLIDQECVYRRTGQSVPEKIACVSAPDRMHNATGDGDQLYLGVLRDNLYILMTLTDDKLETKSSIPAESVSETAQILACAGQMAVFDRVSHHFATAEYTYENISDVQCLDGKWTLLKSIQARNGVWQVSATTPELLWNTEIGFDTTDARMARTSSGRWWLAVEAPESSEPLILMSNDGKSWSWRRDRITDFHSVATAGKYAVAVGDNSTILYSENYGESWTRATTSSSETLRSVCLSSDGTYALAVGDASTIYLADNGISRWKRIKTKLNFDITSCTIAEQKDRFQVYFVGEGGAIYTAPKDLSKLELIATPTLENLYGITTLETGEVIAVGGVYQSPSSICEKGYLLEADVTPRSMWFSFIVALLLSIFWVFSVRKLILGWIHRKDLDDDEI